MLLLKMEYYIIHETIAVTTLTMPFVFMFSCDI